MFGLITRKKAERIAREIADEVAGARVEKFRTALKNAYGMYVNDYSIMQNPSGGFIGGKTIGIMLEDHEARIRRDLFRLAEALGYDHEVVGPTSEHVVFKKKPAKK